MANLIIKSSADNLVLQGSDASPAITVGATGTTTFAENATMSGTLGVTGNTTLSGSANNLGTISSATTFPAGHIVKTSFYGDEVVANHITTTSTSFVDTGIEIAHTTLMSSADSWLLWELYSGMWNSTTQGKDGVTDLTMRTVSNSTYTAAESISAGSYGPSYHYGATTGDFYQPLYYRIPCGLVSEMGMPATKSSWSAGDTLYFRLFYKISSGGTFRIAHGNTILNVIVKEIKR